VRVLRTLEVEPKVKTLHQITRKKTATLHVPRRKEYRGNIIALGKRTINGVVKTKEGSGPRERKKFDARDTETQRGKKGTSLRKCGGKT